MLQILFSCCKNCRPLSRVLLTDWLRQMFSAAGLSGNFSSHSFRIGAATVAARNGVPDNLIQSLGRWSSDVYQLYIRTPAEALASLSQKLMELVRRPLRMKKASGRSLVPVRYVLPRGWAHPSDSAVLGVVEEVRRSPGPLLFAGTSSLQAPWRAAYFGWFPLPGFSWIPPCFA